MLEWRNDLTIRAINLHLDSAQSRPTCFISHAHSDHIASHQTTLCTPETAALSRHRLSGDVPPVNSGYTALAYNQPYAFDPDTRLELLPAGHVLGSAMLHVTRPEGTLLYTGDFTLQRSLTARAAEVREADHLVMETTYGLPCYRFPERRLVIDQFLTLVEAAMRSGRQVIVMGYSLGKGQEITRILTDAGFPVTLHGAPYNLSRLYEQHGVSLGRYRRYAYEDFHGPDAIDLRCRGVLVAPPHVARSAFVTRFKNPLTIMMTGWALLKGAQYRYGVDHCLPLSDHADFEGLMELVDRVRPSRVYTHHGYTREFAEHLRGLGIDASPAEPSGQLELFG